MKPTKTLWRVLIVFSLAGTGLGEDAKKPAIRDVASHAQLAKMLQQSRQSDPMKNMKVVADEADAENVKSRSKDLLNTSDVICYGGMATLVPKRAILHVPKRYSDRFKIQRGAKVRTFSEFARFNRAWLKTIEVTRGQAAGAILIDEKTLESIEKSPLVVVATYHGGPISVLPPKPEAAPESEKEKPSR